MTATDTPAPAPQRPPRQTPAGRAFALVRNTWRGLTSMRTALVLFEGRYSGVVEPDRHFVPLKKDFSNVDEVFAKLKDNAYLEALTERAYEDIIQSGRYTYAAFVRAIDEVLLQAMPMPAPEAPPWLPLPPCDALPSFTAKYVRTFRGSLLKRFCKAMIDRERLKRWWILLPAPLRNLCRPGLHFLRGALK